MFGPEERQRLIVNVATLGGRPAVDRRSISALASTVASRDAKMAICSVCGATVMPPHRRYCSVVCAGEGRRRRRRPRARLGRCAYCRQSFRRSRRGNRYCSSACRKAAWRRAHRGEDPLTVLRRDLQAVGLQPGPLPAARRCRCGGPTILVTKTDADDVLTVKGCRRCLTPAVLRCHHTRLEPPPKGGYRACVSCGGQILTVRRTGSILKLRNR